MVTEVKELLVCPLQNKGGPDVALALCTISIPFCATLRTPGAEKTKICISRLPFLQRFGFNLNNDKILCKKQQQNTPSVGAGGRK